jgi:UDP-4-amino-4,6-dideoxy-N-acetyl-beta-L-altrosamine N-acetyltransferase
MLSYEGERIRLRPVRRADLEKTILWRNDPAIRENMLGLRFPVTEKMEEKWYESVADDPSRSRVVFAIEKLADAELVGITHLSQIDWIARVAFFGIYIGDSRHHGQGMGREAMDILFRYAFDGLNLRKICLQVASYNEAAIRLYRCYGFKEEGVLKEQCYLEGSYHDVILMRLFADEFRQERAVLPAELKIS